MFTLRGGWGWSGDIHVCARYFYTKMYSENLRTLYDYTDIIQNSNGNISNSSVMSIATGMPEQDDKEATTSTLDTPS